MNLETPEYSDDPALAIADGIAAVERTAPGVHVNLVTHAALGDPGGWLHPHLREQFGSAIEIEYVDQCGCGGHVTRVHCRD